MRPVTQTPPGHRRVLIRRTPDEQGRALSFEEAVRQMAAHDAFVYPGCDARYYVFSVPK